MVSCLLAVALLVAIAALTIVLQLRSEVRELRHVIATMTSVRRDETVVDETVAAKPREPVIEEAPIPIFGRSAQTIPPVVEPPAVPEAETAPPPPFTPPPPRVASGVDWENLVGIRLFSWIAGIALVLAAVFLFKYSIDHGWLRPAVRAVIGLATGIGILIVCELRIARNYRFTANAMDGAGIAILYATLFALHARWHLWPVTAAFGGMLLVTAAAVFLSTRRDSVFIALLGLVGGFATPALLSSGENRPIALFSYLLLLNGGISWIAWRKGWPLLTALSVGLTAVYQWAWVERFLTTGQLPLAASIFVLFALVGVSSLWDVGDSGKRPAAFRRIAAAGAVLPLLFALFTAIVPEYGARYNVLFGFLLLMAVGLALIAYWRGPEWLHTLGGAATVVTFFIWLTVSYTSASWPGSLLWLAAFVSLYLAAGVVRLTPAVYTAPLLYFVFFGIAQREPSRYSTLVGAFLALLVFAVVFALRYGRPQVASIAIAFCSLAMMALGDAPAWMAVAAQGILLGLLFMIAWLEDRQLLPVFALPFFAAAVIAANGYSSADQLALTAVLYSLFLVYGFLGGARIATRFAPFLAVALASGVFFVTAYVLRRDLGYAGYIGAIPIIQAVLVLLVMLRTRELAGAGVHDSTIALLASTVLALVTTAIAVQLDKEWITISLALLAAALAWLFRRIPHRGLLAWSGALIVAVLVRLVLNPAVFDYHPKSATPVLNWYLYAYAVSGAAMFAVVRILPAAEAVLRKLAAAGGTIVFFVLLNIQIADVFSSGSALTFNFISSSLAQDLTYTIGWATFAMIMLVIGIAAGSRSARIAALGLLFVTILKCFLHDLARLGGLYRVGSLLGLAVSLVLVGLLLQKFVILKRQGAPVGEQ